jgi:hypothetical protein
MKLSRAVVAWRGLRPALFTLLLTMSGALLATDPPAAKYPNYPSETPANFSPSPTATTTCGAR